MKQIPQKIQSLLDSKNGEVLKLDIGENHQPGFITLGDKNSDILWDLEKYPYPLPDNSITIIKAVHVVEKINPLNKGLIKFMNEMWRMLKYEGQLLISVYYAGSTGYWSDPCNVNGCTQHTWYYFDPINPSGLYNQYQPKPWKIEKSYANPDGVMEVLLIKRREDKWKK